VNDIVKMSRTRKDNEEDERGNSATGKKKSLKASLSHHSLPVDLTPGETITVKLVKSGYITQEVSYTVPSAAATVTKTMYLEKGRLSVATTPTAATVKVDGETRTSPAEFILLPGTYTVEISKPGYETITDSVTIVVDKAVIKSYTLTPSLGALSITTTPTGAKVTVVSPEGFVPRVSCPATPCTFELLPGNYAVKVEKTGYDTITDSVTITLGVTTSKSYTLTPSKGTLSVTTTPTGASIKVGAETKTSPCNFTLAPGTYTVTISKTGYDTITDTVTITAGLTTTKSYTLTLSGVTITFKTLKKDTTELTGTSVYINDVLKGVT
jgi:cytochrome c biogenesis protein CcdA